MKKRLAMTVAGPLPSEQLGVTLVHEHLHMDATPLLAVHGYGPGARSTTTASSRTTS